MMALDVERGSRYKDGVRHRERLALLTSFCPTYLAQPSVLVCVIQQAFAQVMRDLRLQLGISQEELGFRSKYHRTYISQLERGMKAPTLTALFRLANALQASPAEMIERVQRVLDDNQREDTTSEDRS